MAEAITTYVEQTSGGNASKFTEELQQANISISKWSVWAWQQGKQLPQLGTLLQLCYYLGTTPLFLLQGKTTLSACSLPSLLEATPLNHTPQCHSSFDAEKLRLSLRSILATSEYPPPSLVKVAKQLDHDPSHLLKLFPDLCYEISKRYRDFRRMQSIQRKQSVQDEVRQAALRVHAEGKYPSRRQVRALLSNPNLMRLPEALEAWNDTLRELGWNKEV